MSLRFLTWNCQHGSLASRINDVAKVGPHISFIQEWDPRQAPLLSTHCVQRLVNDSKGVALVAHSDQYQLEAEESAFPITGVIRARVEGQISFQALGIWAQGPSYAKHVIDTVSSVADWIRQRPTVVMGDFNSGTNMSPDRQVTRSHFDVIEVLKNAGLTSAY